MRGNEVKNFGSRLWLKVLPLLIIVAVVSTNNLGMWARMNVEVPVERLLNNVGTYLKENPSDPQGYYVLGRLYSLAFAMGTESLEVYQKNDQPLPGFAPWESIIIKRNAPGPLSEKARDQLIRSVQNYRRATELAPNQAMSFLGLGWMLESGAKFADQVGPPPDEEKTGKSADVWRERALAAYRKAYDLTINGDLKRNGLGPAADSAISLEAGQGIARILELRKRTNDEEVELNRVRESVKTLQGKTRAITPIIFPMKRARPLNDLLASDKLVRFDLAGDGEPGWWPWVQPDTGILVWDPKRSGRVESGLQLFGSSTWWMSWQNGYQPLAALDDNRDGQLANQELDGLAVWRDRNTNGISEPGEVIPAKTLGITSISVAATATVNGVLSNPQGLRLSDGSTLPTYDWTPTEVKYPILSMKNR